MKVKIIGSQTVLDKQGFNGRVLLANSIKVITTAISTNLYPSLWSFGNKKSIIFILVVVLVNMYIKMLNSIV